METGSKPATEALFTGYMETQGTIFAVYPNRTKAQCHPYDGVVWVSNKEAMGLGS